MASQHGGHLEALGEGEQFVYRTQILKETVAFSAVLQAENGIKKGVYGFCFDFFIHF